VVCVRLLDDRVHYAFGKSSWQNVLYCALDIWIDTKWHARRRRCRGSQCCVGAYIRRCCCGWYATWPSIAARPSVMPTTSNSTLSNVRHVTLTRSQLQCSVINVIHSPRETILIYIDLMEKTSIPWSRLCTARGPCLYTISWIPANWFKQYLYRTLPYLRGGQVITPAQRCGLISSAQCATPM